MHINTKPSSKCIQCNEKERDVYNINWQKTLKSKDSYVDMTQQIRAVTDEELPKQSKRDKKPELSKDSLELLEARDAAKQQGRHEDAREMSNKFRTSLRKTRRANILE